MIQSDFRQGVHRYDAVRAGDAPMAAKNGTIDSDAFRIGIKDERCKFDQKQLYPAQIPKHLTIVGVDESWCSTPVGYFPSRFVDLFALGRSW